MGVGVAVDLGIMGVGVAVDLSRFQANGDIICMPIFGRMGVSTIASMHLSSLAYGDGKTM